MHSFTYVHLLFFYRWKQVTVSKVCHSLHIRITNKSRHKDRDGGYETFTSILSCFQPRSLGLGLWVNLNVDLKNGPRRLFITIIQRSSFIPSTSFRCLGRHRRSGQDAHGVTLPVWLVVGSPESAVKPVLIAGPLNDRRLGLTGCSLVFTSFQLGT